MTTLAGLALAVVGTGGTTLPAPARPATPTTHWTSSPTWTTHVDDVLAVAGPIAAEEATR